MQRLVGFLALGVAACQPAADHDPYTARLDPQALSAFQTHIRALGQGALSCSDAAIESAPRVEADLNQDGRPDYALETRAMDCEARVGIPEAYFCGTYFCAFPALISTPDGYEVIPMMSGHEISVYVLPQEEQFQVRQMDMGGPHRDRVRVRYYAWREGALQRVNDRVEIARRSD